MTDSNFNPAPSQPLVVYFEVNIGGLTKIYQSPEIPIDFKLVLSGTENTVEMTLYDVTGKYLEPFIWNSRSTSTTGLPGGTFQFGYLGSANNKSSVYTFNLDSWSPQPEGNSFVLKMIGTVVGSIFISSNQYSGTVREVLQQIADNHNMTLNINPDFGDFYMQDLGKNEVDTTSAGPLRVMKLVDESDQSFINRILSYARDQENKGAYKYYITCMNGKPTLNIVRAQNTSPQWSYTVQTAESVVKDWKPDLCFTGVVFGSNDNQEKGYSKLSGDEMTKIAQQKFMEQYQETFGYPTSPLAFAIPPKPDADDLVYFNSESMPDSVTGSSVRSRPSASSSSYAGLSPFTNSQLASWLENATAELVILGDPSIDATFNGTLNNVQVTYFYPENYNTDNSGAQTEHYSSGTYILEGVTHSISAGDFTSTLSLYRANVTQPDTTGITPDSSVSGQVIGSGSQ